MERLLSVNHGPVIFDLDASVVDLVVMEGTNSRLGARPIRNYVETAFQNAIAQKRLEKGRPSGKVTIQNSKFLILNSESASK